MTRITSLGRKRTHVEATFNYHEADPDHDAGPSLEDAGDCSVAVTNAKAVEVAEDGRGADGQPPKKKRKRGPRKKAGVKVANGTCGEGEEGGEKGDINHEGAGKNTKEPSQKNGGKNKGKSRALQDRKEASEKRRRRRIAERNVNTTCFACREKGHAVQDCPKIADGSIKPPENQSGFSATGVVGICYRCGSRKHRLSACREKVSDPSDPLPFASCFVCNGNGHLASRCPKNQEKGVYPNGGSCKLCGETDHLARNCKLRDKAVVNNTAFLGTGVEAGADEDDFHTFKRKSAEVDKEQKVAERVQKSRLKNQVRTPKEKKVVNF
ncbi:hypothetical protein BJ322DRAFT_1134429 [Thelephora terrestris]|uniref:CCHC-type domain-containing protein n=1 Tax=Thelephora terrestris TaxID=56493 RepID=A0A9P6HU83_9AGAM|nr:hypothetical protein BJ322DRAFT_1134429 [Thelephora terrestris]